MEVSLKGPAKRKHMNLQECRQRALDSGALTRPQAVIQNHGAHDPNRGLYPRESAKRKRTEQSSFDAEVLAGTSSSEKSEEDEEIDDACLLAVALQQEQQEQEEADYLEGMTAEMFGEDPFHRVDEDVRLQVEDVPDIHYGLLGSDAHLQQPRSCINDLPMEVLRQVLILLPAQDLYCCVRLVCQDWRSIVDDPKFVPHRKRYFRFTMLEENTFKEVADIMKERGIDRSHYSMRNLIAYMAEHEFAELVDPSKLLSCVTKHRLFPQAEACVRLRLSNIPKFIHHDTEGPTPCAVMAVLLVLSENVDDVQQLVTLLGGCMSHVAITEFLNHMATMLLAMKRKYILISNRLHYNIYYVLHLMENGPFPACTSDRGRPQIHLTREQQLILSHTIQNDHVVKIKAFAGTGKTTTLVQYAEQFPHLRFLYVAFNKSVASEARKRFPHNVDCRTAHSLAYKDTGVWYRLNDKLTFNHNPFTISTVLPKGRGGFTKAKIVMNTLNTFMASTDETITTRHVPNSRVIEGDDWIVFSEYEKQMFVEDARHIWSKMKELKETKTLAYHMTHDGYLKLWQLQTPKPQLDHLYDVIFIDEAQDCTPAIMDVLLSQRCGKVLVGDPHQQIYTFRGAVNALDCVDHTHIYYLTQSFRFGSEIAYVGATILSVCKKVRKILVGGKQRGSVLGEPAATALASITAAKKHGNGTTAILSRCNLSVFDRAVHLIDTNPLCQLHFIGGLGSVGLNMIMEIWQLFNGNEHKPNHFKEPLIRCFAKAHHPYQALKNYASKTEDHNLEGKLKIVEKYHERIPDLVTHLKKCFVEDFSEADFILGTVHKAKGLEFDTVLITDDFVAVPCAKHQMKDHTAFSLSRIPADEWNLLYVAVTRARTVMIMTPNIQRILTMDGEYFMTSEMPRSQEVTCSIHHCSNTLTPGMAFTMSRRSMSCLLNPRENCGGPLCGRCVWIRTGPFALLMTDYVHSWERLRPHLYDAPQMLHCWL
ncbi:F-box DNA helicase 1 isoform X1 [Synchiropus splendidus]|uniref:F-box DNA helicase 1 isoform X1 n=1 Tax=Synchiropus splendidus TaxID=270530 RepID=UPI00237E75CF|nr:F-box DNA helicase 1 isoform X1 [Synchiropus splendidus]